MASERLYQMTAYSRFGLVRGGQENLVFGDFDILDRQAKYHPTNPDHLMFFNALVQNNGHKAYVSIIDQDILLAVGHKALLREIEKNVRMAVKDSYQPEFRESSGEKEARRLRFSFKPINQNLDLFSFYSHKISGDVTGN